MLEHMIRTSSWLTAIKGPLGGPSGSYVYMYRGMNVVQPRRSKTSAGAVAKGPHWVWAQFIFQILDTYWHSLSNLCRACWTQQAKNFRPWATSGWDYFVHVNMNRMMLGMPGITGPPERPASVKQRMVHNEDWPSIPPSKTIPVWKEGAIKGDGGGGTFDPDTGQIPVPPDPPPPFPPPEEEEEPPPPPPAPCECPEDLGMSYGITDYDVDFFDPPPGCVEEGLDEWDGLFWERPPPVCYWEQPGGLAIGTKTPCINYLWLKHPGEPCYWDINLECETPGERCLAVWLGHKTTGLTPEGIYTRIGGRSETPLELEILEV